MCQMEVALLQGRRPGDASVENVGIKVRSVRPNYGTQLRIDAELGEVGGIAQRLEDSVEAEIGREIDHALNAIFEPKMQATIAERFCGNKVLQHDLLHRRNGIELRRVPRQIPILDQLGASRKTSSQQSSCLHGDERLLAGLPAGGRGRPQRTVPHARGPPPKPGWRNSTSVKRRTQYRGRARVS